MLERKEGIRNDILYRGQQYDQEAGQYYLRARYYNPVIGRFTQEDTYRGDGLNLYAYCGNNPVMYYDPSGHNQISQPVVEPEGSKVINENSTGMLENTANPVAAGPSLVQQGTGYDLKEAAERISPINGYTDVVIHGTPDSFGVWHNGKWEYIDQRSLATFLKNNPEYAGGPVRLISCSTGANPNGIAQQLANKLGVNVLAPSDTLYIYPNGSTVIGSNPYTNTGSWELFVPGNH